MLVLNGASHIHDVRGGHMNPLGECDLARSTSCKRPSRWFIWGSRQCGEGIVHENFEEVFIYSVHLGPKDPECRCGVEYKPNGKQISQHIFRGSEIDRVSQKILK